MRFTGNRFDLYEDLLSLRRKKLLSAADYSSAIVRLEGMEKKHQEKLALARKRREEEAEKKRIARVNEALRVAEEKEKARKAKKALKAKERREVAKTKKLKDEVMRSVLFDESYENDARHAFTYELWKAIRGKGTIRLIQKEGSQVVENKIVQVPATYGDAQTQWYDGTDGPCIFEGQRVIALESIKLARVNIAQFFANGIHHCVFVPILNKLNELHDNCSSKEMKKKMRSRIRRIEEKKITFEAGIERIIYENVGGWFDEQDVFHCEPMPSKKIVTGVPIDEMEDVAKTAGMKIIINDCLGNNLFVFNEFGRVTTMTFTNTRRDHIEYGKITLNSEPIIVSQDELIALWRKLQEDGEFYMIDGDVKKGLPRKLFTLTGRYELFNEDKEYFDAMNKAFHIDDYKINASKYPELNTFLREGRIINSWPCKVNDIEPTGVLDMPKAYTQFKKCSYYCGFPGMIHQMRKGIYDKEWLIKYPGYYSFTVLKGCNVPMFNYKVGDSGVLPSVEILYFMEKGCNFSITIGAWGSMFDMDFPDSMLEDRRYCRWAGRLSCERPNNYYSFSADKLWAASLRYDHDVFYYDTEKIATVVVPKKSYYTAHHILGFITAYVRIQIMEAMEKIGYENVVKVVLDGIYYAGERPSGFEGWNDKEIRTHTVESIDWYKPCSFDIDVPALKFVENTLVRGQGGAGKTYMLLTDKGFHNVLYAAPTNKLAFDNNKKYGVHTCTVNKLLGIGFDGKKCRSYKEEFKQPAVLVVDELTMISADWIPKLFEMYKGSLILLLGDVTEEGRPYQCRLGASGKVFDYWKPIGVNQYIVEGDRRSRDNELIEMKLRIREEMDKNYNTFNGMDWVLENCSIVGFNTACSMFSTDDIWIAGTDRTNQKLMSAGVISGWYKKGGRIEKVVDDVMGWEKRGSFTIHCFQGNTVETGKIFISITDLFETGMLYTAVSRAVHFDQLIFVA